MQYFGCTNTPNRNDKLDYAKVLWGAGPLPVGAEIIGGYSDTRRTGALIRLASGNLVCGYSGAISSVDMLAIGYPSPTDIRQSRLSLGLTQSQAGEIIGASRRTWQSWEIGARVMPSAKWELWQIKTKGK